MCIAYAKKKEEKEPRATPHLFPHHTNPPPKYKKLDKSLYTCTHYMRDTLACTLMILFYVIMYIRTYLQNSDVTYIIHIAAWFWNCMCVDVFIAPSVLLHSLGI